MELRPASPVSKADQLGSKGVDSDSKMGHIVTQSRIETNKHSHAVEMPLTGVLADVVGCAVNRFRPSAKMIARRFTVCENRVSKLFLFTQSRRFIFK
jgi:hypothetical protein